VGGGVGRGGAGARTRVESWPEFTRFSGQHTFHGFCIARGVDEPLGDSIPAEDLHRLMRVGASDGAAATGGAAAM
jgi:hypothetical protein